MTIRIIIEEEERFAADYDIPGLSKGGFISLFGHAAVFFMVAMVTHQKEKTELLLTEISLVDQIIPIPEEEEPPPPVPIAPLEKKNVWDFLKQTIPIKRKAELANQLPIDLPKKQDKIEMAMPDALKLGSKKDMDKPMMDKPLDLVGRKAVKQPAGMNMNALKMNKRKDSLANTAKLPSGIKLGKKSSFLPQQQRAVVNTKQFARRANLQARGGSLADMPTIKKPKKKKKILAFDTSNLTIKREKNTFQIFGPLKDRRRIKIYLPKYPRWAEEQNIECSVSLHLFVLPSGIVKNNLYVEQSSGYSELDKLALTALSKFQFAPLGSGARQEEQEGVIVFYFRLSR
jgi:TonB family protein